MTAAPAIVQPRELPILFSAPMINAILENRKNQTRRIIKPRTVKPSKALPVRIETGCDACWADSVPHNGESAENGFGGPCYLRVPACDHVGPDGYPGGGRIFPRWNVGDHLWVRETWGDADIFYQSHTTDEPRVVAYRADHQAIQWNTKTPRKIPKYDIDQWNWAGFKWRPSIFLPRWASRITLEVTAVRVERLQDITEEDARAEGVLSKAEQNVCELDAPELTWGRDRYRDLWGQINGAGSWATNPWVFCLSFRKVTS